MNYYRYYPIDVVNGPGTRCSLFVSGCIHKCQGCYNANTWSPTAGKLFTQEIEDQIIRDLNHPEIKRQGLTLTGGDPLYPENLASVLKLVQRVREECPNKDIWLWTGYVLADLLPEQQKIVNYLDVLIDGKFEQSLADPSLLWKGSGNQVVHFLKT